MQALRDAVDAGEQRAEQRALLVATRFPPARQQVDLQEAHRLAPVRQHDVSGILDHDDVVRLGEVDDLRVESLVRQHAGLLPTETRSDDDGREDEDARPCEAHGSSAPSLRGRAKGTDVGRCSRFLSDIHNLPTVLACTVSGVNNGRRRIWEGHFCYNLLPAFPASHAIFWGL